MPFLEFMSISREFYSLLTFTANVLLLTNLASCDEPGEDFETEVDELPKACELS